MSTLADYIDAIENMAPGSHPLDASVLANLQGQAVSKAMDIHGKNKPVVEVEDIAGDGGFDYPVSGLASWVDEFSRIRSVEYPVDDSDENPDVLDSADWTIYAKPAGKVLRFLTARPAATESMRITYTGRHSCTTQDCTVAAGDEEAVQSLAASFYCLSLAAAYVQDQDSTIAADTVNQGPRHNAFVKLAKEYRKQYDDHMGITPGKPKPAVSIADQDVNYPGGMDRLTHPRRYR